MSPSWLPLGRFQGCDTMKLIGVKRMCVTPHLSVEKGDPLLSDESSFYNSCEYRCFAGFVISLPKDPK